MGLTKVCQFGLVASLAAWGGSACSGGTEGPSTSGPGPGPVESPSPTTPECLGCGDILDLLSSGGEVEDVDDEMCDGTDDVLEDLGECVCSACPTSCAGVCGGEGSISAGCWSCVNAQCSGTLTACEAN